MEEIRVLAESWRSEHVIRGEQHRLGQTFLAESRRGGHVIRVEQEGVGQTFVLQSASGLNYARVVTFRKDNAPVYGSRTVFQPGEELHLVAEEATERTQSGDVVANGFDAGGDGNGE